MTHGLRLAIVPGIPKSHNAPINVQSTPGKGATLEVVFQRAGEIAASASSAPAAVSNREVVSEIVLRVEDEDQLRIATAAAFQKARISVISSSGGLNEAFRDRANDIGIAVLD